MGFIYVVVLLCGIQGMKRISIRDIARALHVTPSTVSRALKGEPRISEKTRQAVLELAEKWGYRPNPFAKSLLLNKTYTIGLIIPEFTHHFFNQVLRGIESVTYEKGYHLIICTSDNAYEKEKKSVQTLLDLRVDGLLAAIGNNSKTFDHFQEILDIEVPLVLVDRICEDVETSYVVTNDFEGAMQATEYLIGRGGRQIGYIKGPVRISTTFNRFMGYKEALKKWGIPFCESLVFDSDEPQNLRNQLIPLLKNKQIDAVFAHSDYLAYEAIDIVQSAGLQVPGDIAVMGYANEPIASFMSPKLSTVRQPAFDMGRVAASFLMQKLAGEIDNDKIMIESLSTELVIRASTK